MKKQNKNLGLPIRLIAAVATALVLVSSMGLLGLVAAQDPTDESDFPSDVEGLIATPGDGKVQLSWEPASDNVVVAGYKIYRGTQPVTATENLYNLPAIPVGNVTSYTVKNLTNDQAYYFSVTAVDDEGNESPNYAYEVNATPASGLRLASVEDDGKAPQVQEVYAENKVTVLVTFSEVIKLPEEQPASAFLIEALESGSTLEVENVWFDERDESGKTVVLITAAQEPAISYIITAGIEIQDLYENPIISGTSDTGSFEGSSVEPPIAEPDADSVADPAADSADSSQASAGTPDPAPALPPLPPAENADIEAPEVLEGAADFTDQIALKFSEKIVLPEDPITKITVTKKDSPENTLEVKNVTLSVDGKTMFITTSTQEAVEYEVALADLGDEAGNILADDADMIVVTGHASSLEDLVPPEDVTNLISALKKGEANIVGLRWDASKNTAGDLIDQFLYQSTGKNGNEFGGGTSTGDTTTAVEVEDLTPGNWYTFKVTAIDNSGNESPGAVTSIFLPKTGPGMVAAALTGLVMAWRRKRKGAARSRSPHLNL